MKTDARRRPHLGIEVAEDRFISVNGPAAERLPGWGLLRMTDVEFHLHPPIAFEIHYRVPLFVTVHTFNGAPSRLAVGDGPLAPTRLSAGSALLVLPQTRVRCIQDAPLEFLALGIPPARVTRAVGAEAAKEQDGAAVMADAGLHALAGEIRRVLIAEPFAASAYLDALADAVIQRLADRHLARPLAAGASGGLPPAVARRVAEAVEARLAEGVCASDLAEAAGLSRSHFTRAFEASFGVPPGRYIAARRTARARTMLTEGGASMTEIAAACGFASPSHFATAFRQEIGMTPSAYRRALRTG